MENQTLKTIFTRHSVRDFTGEIINKENLLLILRAGMSAPTAVNIQPWAFIVVRNRETLDILCEKLPYAKMLSKSGAAIIVCGVPDKDNVIAKKFWAMDCASASENILLAAHALGYGAVWTAVYPNEKLIKAVRRILHLPENIIPLNVIPIGIPTNKDEKPKDKFKEENIHWEKW